MPVHLLDHTHLLFPHTSSSTRFTQGYPRGSSPQGHYFHTYRHPLLPPLQKGTTPDHLFDDPSPVPPQPLLPGSHQGTLHGSFPRAYVIFHTFLPVAAILFGMNLNIYFFCVSILWKDLSDCNHLKKMLKQCFLPDFNHLLSTVTFKRTTHVLFVYLRIGVGRTP